MYLAWECIFVSLRERFVTALMTEKDAGSPFEQFLRRLFQRYLLVFNVKSYDIRLTRLVHSFTARWTLVQSAVLRSHVVCLSVRLSVCLSVTLVNCDHIGWNSSKIISPLVSLGRSLFATPTWRVCSKGNTPKFGPKVTDPLLIWASETFDRKLWPNGYR